MQHNTLEKGLRILEILAANAREYGVLEIAEISNIDKSIVCRLLQTLCKKEYIVQNPINRKYKIGLRPLELSASILSKMELCKIGLPYLHELSNQTNEVTYLGVSYRNQVITISTIYPKGMYREDTPAFGHTMSYDDSAMGKVLLASMDEKQAMLLVSHWDKLKDEINNVKIHKTAKIIKNNALVGIASPVRNRDGLVIAAMGLSLSFEKWESLNKKDLQDLLLRTATSLSFGLGYAADRLI